MKQTRICELLGIKHPILQAGLPWISNPELVAAVSNAGGLGVLHPTAAMASDGDAVVNLQENISRVQRLTSNPFAVALYLPNPLVPQLIEVAVQEGVHIAVTYGGSPALHTGELKDNGFTVLHSVASVRHARGAEAQGVDAVIADGFEGGGLRGAERIPTAVLVPQVARAVSIPVIASGGIADSRGYAAVLALGADGAQMGSRFTATTECIAHPAYKGAIVAAIDTGTIVVGGERWPTRIIRNDNARQLRAAYDNLAGNDLKLWEEALGMAKARPAMLEGDLESGIAYAGASAGLISEVLTVAEVFQELVEGGEAQLRRLL